MATGAQKGEVLVAVLNNVEDFDIVKTQHWYRIPTMEVARHLDKWWPPRWLGFYHTKKFGDEAHSIRYYARVENIRDAWRWQLFPEEARNPKSRRQYYQLMLGELQTLPAPIFSRRQRRVVFIPTIWDKFINASEINDLYKGSPLTDKLWAEFKRWQIDAERQASVTVNGKRYELDFAIYCEKGKLAVGLENESLPIELKQSLESDGWQVLGLDKQQVEDRTDTYCLNRISRVIEQFGGTQKADE
ncbi:MAG: hypothetical protein AAF512_07200 [Pseudomonadota bacterium]